MTKIVQYLPALINGGIESMLLNYYSKLNDKYEFIIIVNGSIENNCSKKFQELGAKIYQIPYWKKNLHKHNKELYKILKNEKPDIFHVHFGIANFLSCLIAMIAGIKIRISHCHTYIPNKSLKNKIFTILSRLFATDYAACGVMAAQYLVGKKKIKKVNIIYNAIDLKKYSYNDNTRIKLRKKYKWEKYKIYGNIGRFNFQKNQLFLINIFEEIYKKDNNSRFVIIGGTDVEYNNVISKINCSTIKDYCIVLRDIGNVNEYYSFMDVLLLPSLYEGFAVTVIEAQASNLPCVLSPTISKEFNSNCIYYSKSLFNINDWISAIDNIKYKNRYKNKIDLKLFDISSSYILLDNYYKKILKRR